MPHNSADLCRVHHHSVTVLDSYEIKMYLINIIHVWSMCVFCLYENGKFKWNEQLALNTNQFPIQALRLGTRLYRSCALAHPDVISDVKSMPKSVTVNIWRLATFQVSRSTFDIDKANLHIQGDKCAYSLQTKAKKSTLL